MRESEIDLINIELDPDVLFTFTIIIEAPCRSDPCVTVSLGVTGKSHAVNYCGVSISVTAYTSWHDMCSLQSTDWLTQRGFCGKIQNTAVYYPLKLPCINVMYVIKCEILLFPILIFQIGIHICVYFKCMLRSLLSRALVYSTSSLCNF